MFIVTIKCLKNTIFKHHNTKNIIEVSPASQSAYVGPISFYRNTVPLNLPSFRYQNMALYGCAHTHQEHEIILNTSIQHLDTKSVIINRRTHNAFQELSTELSNGTSEGV